MKKQALFILCFLLSLGFAHGVFREHEEFKVSDVKVQSIKLIGKVDKNRWVSLNVRDSVLSVSVSMDEDGLYSLVFGTRYEGFKFVDNNAVSRRTINFVTVPKATVISGLSAKGVLELEVVLRKIAGSFSVMTESTYDKNQNPVASIQKVSCSVVSKKSVFRLIEAYFAHVDQKLVIWEDSN